MNVRSASRLASVAMVLVLVGAACASETEAPTAAPAATTAPASAGEEAPTPDATEPVAPDAPQAAVAELLDFSAASADGGTINMADYAGQDILLWFWAPW